MSGGKGRHCLSPPAESPVPLDRVRLARQRPAPDLAGEKRPPWGGAGAGRAFEARRWGWRAWCVTSAMASVRDGAE